MMPHAKVPWTSLSADVGFLCIASVAHQDGPDPRDPPICLGQERDSITPFEDRMRIWEQSWLARDREETGTSAPDPMVPNRL